MNQIDTAHWPEYSAPAGGDRADAEAEKWPMRRTFLFVVATSGLLWGAIIWAAWQLF